MIAYIAIGAGIVAFGEVGQDIYDCSEVYVDSWANAKTELKDLKAKIVAEVGEIIISEKVPQPKQMTIFQQMGKYNLIYILDRYSRVFSTICG